MALTRSPSLPASVPAVEPTDGGISDPNTAMVAGVLTSNKRTTTQRPATMNAFEFVIVSKLRAAQLMRGCTARVAETGKATTTAQREVAAGKVARTPPTEA